MLKNPVNWFEIYVQDMDRAKAFYEAVLQITLKHLAPPADPAEQAITMWAFPMVDGDYGASGALTQMQGVTPGGSGTLVYFSCEDCALEAARAAEHGGRVVQEKMAIGDYGFIALVNDTEGNMIGLHSMQ
jgi:predicted enzyme related to lactoylglutathione lyase